MEQKTDAQKTILIVEDEKNIVDILRFNLQREGYRTVEAYDGADGLEKARKENPDLILLDVMLPKMIGFDVCRTLREEGNNVPVIILTAREEEADKVSGLEIGADDYITKPFSMRELIARVGANIRRTAMNTAAAATAAATALPTRGSKAFGMIYSALSSSSETSSASACAAAIFISSLMSLARTSKTPRKMPGKASTLLIWLG